MPTERTMPRLQIILDWRLFTAVAAMSTVLLALATAHGDERHSPPKPIDFAHDIAPLIKAPLRQVPHRRHLQGLVLARHPRDDAQVEGRRPRKERRERADRAAHVRRSRVSDAPQGSTADRREVGRLKRGSTRRCPGRPGSRSSGRATWPRSSCAGPSCPPPAMAATIRSIASSTPISLAHGVSPPPPLGDAAFARRAFLDVIGLPPPPRAGGVRERPVPRQASPADPPAAATIGGPMRITG